MDERALKLAPGLLVSLAGDGAQVWQPQRRTLTTLDADLLALLTRFGEGRTIGDAAAAAGLEADESVVAAVESFVAAALLVPVAAAAHPEPPQPRARARIEELVDPQSFVEEARGPIVTGFGTVDGRRVAVAAWEPLADGGIEDVLALQERVAAAPCPLVYLFDLFSIGQTSDQFAGPRAVGRIYANQGRLSGVAPQLGVVYGSLWRPAALLPAQCDAVVMIEGQSFVHMGDVDAVRQFTGEVVTAEALGGARMHAETSGLAHLVARSSGEAATLARRYLAAMPTSSTAPLPTVAPVPPPAMAPAVLDRLVPDDADAPFAIGELAAALADEGSLVELRARFVRELMTALARLDGIPVGIVANRATHKGGIVTAEAADKAARFVTLCDAYGLPLVFLVDTPGVALGSAAERAGIERAVGRLFGALATSAVPRLTLVVRKAHTAGLYAMCGPAFDPDAFLALPTASVAVFGERMIDFERALDDEAARASLRQFRRATRPRPHGLVDAVVKPSEARAALVARLRALVGEPRPRLRRFIPA